MKHTSRPCRRHALWLVAAALSLTACTPQLRFSSPERAPLAPLTAASSPILAWSPDSQRLALAREGLVLVDIASGAEQRTTVAAPRVAAWGQRGLAVAGSEGDRSWIELLDAEAASQATLDVEGRIVAVAWADDTLLALLSREKTYRFGVQQTWYLLRWSGSDAPHEEQISESTIKPTTAQHLGPRLPFGATMALSPFGDELVYTRIYDAPVFRPVYQLVVRHLGSGVERVAATQPLMGHGFCLLPDGESALVSSTGGIERVQLWTETVSRHSNIEAAHIAASGSLVYADGVLTDAGEPVWVLERPASASFSPDGSRVAVQAQGLVYVLDVEGSPQPQPPSEDHLKLRRLRAMGLITQADYLRFTHEER